MSRTSFTFKRCNRRRVFECAGFLQSISNRSNPISASSARLRTTSTPASRQCFCSTSRGSSIKYEWIDGVEDLELYEPGGYHPLMIDDVLHDRYRIVDKLGHGGYSTIWLARDEACKRYVAVKVCISSSEASSKEPLIIQALKRSSSNSRSLGAVALPDVLDTFEICGPNGTHACYTLTPAQGSLAEAAFCRLFPVRIARALAAKLTTAVSFVHSRGFVHGGMSSLILAQSLQPKANQIRRYSPSKYTSETAFDNGCTLGRGFQKRVWRA